MQLNPYDLHPPARMITPLYRPLGSPPLWDDSQVTIGEMTVRRRSWREPGRPVTVTVTVQCDALPHCQACECGDSHQFTLTDADMRALKGILP